MMFKKAIKGIALALALSALMVPAVFADDADVTINAGTLSFTVAPNVPNFAAVTLNGRSNLTTNATVSAFEVTDARGNGAGWSVTAAATQFQEWDGTAYVSGGHTIPVGSMSLSTFNVTPDGFSDPTPPALDGGPWTIDDGNTYRLVRAGTDEGMGAYDLADTTPAVLTLTVPPHSYAGTYRSDVTITLANDPGDL